MIKSSVTNAVISVVYEQKDERSTVAGQPKVAINFNFIN